MMKSIDGLPFSIPLTYDCVCVCVCSACSKRLKLYYRYVILNKTTSIDKKIFVFHKSNVSHSVVFAEHARIYLQYTHHMSLIKNFMFAFCQ